MVVDDFEVLDEEVRAIDDDFLNESRPCPLALL